MHTRLGTTASSRKVLANIAAALIPLFWPNQANGEDTFFQPSDPHGSVHEFSPLLSEEELPWDHFGDDDPLSESMRYASNIHHPWRIVANPYFGRTEIEFALFDLNPSDTSGIDKLEIGWHGFAPEHTLTGAHHDETFNIPWTEPRDLMNPGLELVFTSGGNHAMIDDEIEEPVNLWEETEGDGFIIEKIRLFPHTNDVHLADEPATIEEYDNIVGFLLPDEDVIEFALEGPREVALWDVGGDPTNEIEIFGRCGSRPSPSDFDQYDTTRDDSAPLGPTGAWLTTPDPELHCGSARYYIAIRNSSPSPRMVRLTARRSRGYWSNGDDGYIHVGVAWDASPNQLDLIASTLRNATTAFYGASEGQVFVQGYEIFDNASNCDNGVTIDSYACWGEACQICWSETQGTSMTTRTLLDGYISIRDPDGPGPGVNTSWKTLTHEFGHSFMVLRDEYVHLGTTCSSGKVWMCGASIMARGAFQWNTRSLCTPINHRTGILDERITVNGNYAVTNGPDFWDCKGDRHWTNVGPNLDNGTGYPPNRSASNQIYEQFRGRNDVLADVIVHHDN